MSSLTGHLPQKFSLQLRKQNVIFGTFSFKAARWKSAFRNNPESVCQDNNNTL